MTERDICTSMFVAALFTIARIWKQPRCPLRDEWLQKLWYINIIKYYSAIKKNTFVSVLMRWMNLDPLYRGKKSESKRQAQLSVTPSTHSLPSSFVHGIFQAWNLEQMAISPPGHLLKLGIEPTSPVSPAFGMWILYHWTPGKPIYTLPCVK